MTEISGNQPIPTKKSPNMVIKALILGGISFVLLLASFFVFLLVWDREGRSDSAKREVSSKWASEQKITGPILTIPYLEKTKTGYITEYLQLMPKNLNYKVNLTPEVRSRSLFSVMVYKSQMEITGNFDFNEIYKQNIDAKNFILKEAFVSIGISDLRGIYNEMQLNLGEKVVTFESGNKNGSTIDQGIFGNVNLESLDPSKLMNFNLMANIKGSDNIAFCPIGKTTKVTMKSSWQNPSFNGNFLPDAKTISDKGFTAEWNVLALNRTIPSCFKGQKYITNNEFGVSLKGPIDAYKKTNRTLKYAILFIFLTFVIFYLIEYLNNRNIHPIHYLLIGFALILFYVLLLSFAEQIAFNLAYLIASIMTIGVICWFAQGLLKSSKLVALVGVSLSILYGYIFALLHLEDLALLFGSLGLFVLLIATMYFSKKASSIVTN